LCKSGRADFEVLDLCVLFSSETVVTFWSTAAMWNIWREWVALFLSYRTRKVSRRRTLILEGLEGRVTPAVYNVTTLADVVSPTDGLLSLREAITLANATPVLDTINLPIGTLRVRRPGINDNANLTGDFDINAPVVINGSGINNTAVSR
jgi:hypothetical protein